MDRNRCYNCSRKKSFQTITTMRLLFLSSVFLLVNFHYSSYNHYAGAFVIRERSNVVIRQRQDQQTITTCDRRDIYNVCRSGRNMNIGMDSCNIFPDKASSSRNTILFASVVTDQEQEQETLIVAQEQSNLDSTNSIPSMPTTTEVTSSTQPSTSSATTSQIEVVMPNNGATSVSLVNGVTAAAASKKVTTMTTDDKAALLGQMKKKSVEKDQDDVDVPRATANGGYSHTTNSRAKISAANKGKTPWNKGKPRSPEVKARIAAGVRAKNRQDFLKKLEDMGLTEEAYEAQEKEKLRIVEAERQSRKTPNGGYRPTEATKRKISMILKEKHAKGEVKPRAKADPSKVRKGFTHTAETREKISQSLRKRWKNDEGFQEKMKESVNSRKDVRQKISDSLKKKWQDPEFRSGMMEKMSQRKSGKDAMNYDKTHREKISEAMKLKWQDPSYREKTLSSIKKSANTRKVTTPRKSRAAAKSKIKTRGLEELKPMTATDISKRKTTKKKVARKRAATPKVDKDDDVSEVTAATVRKLNSQASKLKGATSSTTTSSSIDLSSSEDEAPVEKEKKKKTKSKTKEKKKKEKDGSVNRLREERRDLFDLLYGDEDDMSENEDGDIGKLLSDSSPDMEDIMIGDEDLDSFDPYGLDDY